MVAHMTETTSPTEWIRTHRAIVSIAAGALILGGSGVAYAATLPQDNTSITDTTATDGQPTNSDTNRDTTTSSKTDLGADGPATNSSTGPDNDDQTTAPGTGNPPATNPPAADPEPAPVEEPPYIAPTPGPAYANITANGDGTYTIAWATPDMHGATLDHYWVDIVDPTYSRGDRITPIYSNSVTATMNDDLRCAVVAAVSTEGVQGEVSGPICW